MAESALLSLLADFLRHPVVEVRTAPAAPCDYRCGAGLKRTSFSALQLVNVDLLALLILFSVYRCRP